jgi:hypothetical protein
MKPVASVNMLMVAAFLLIPLLAGAEDKPFVYSDKGKQDPFLRLVSSTGAIVNFDGELVISDMALEGIIAGENGDNVAVINGIIVKPDDQLGPYSVKKVGSDAVILQKDQERFVLKLRREE